VKDKRGQLLLYLMNILCKLYILRTLTVTLVGKSLEVEEVELYNLHSSHYYYGCEKGVHRHLPFTCLHILVESQAIKVNQQTSIDNDIAQFIIIYYNK